MEHGLGVIRILAENETPVLKSLKTNDNVIHSMDTPLRTSSLFTSCSPGFVRLFDTPKPSM